MVLSYSLKEMEMAFLYVGGKGLKVGNINTPYICGCKAFEDEEDLPWFFNAKGIGRSIGHNGLKSSCIMKKENKFQSEIVVDFNNIR